MITTILLSTYSACTQGIFFKLIFKYFFFRLRTNQVVFFFRFNYKQISDLMGDTNSTTYITMIRNPVDIFVSAWEYYKLGGSYKMTLGKI